MVRIVLWDSPYSPTRSLLRRPYWQKNKRATLPEQNQIKIQGNRASTRESRLTLIQSVRTAKARAREKRFDQPGKSVKSVKSVHSADKEIHSPEPTAGAETVDETSGVSSAKLAGPGAELERSVGSRSGV